MFGVGLHFSRRRPARRAPRRPARRARADRVATRARRRRSRGSGAGRWARALVFGLSLSVASTVVAAPDAGGARHADTPDGRIAVGWLDRRGPGDGARARAAAGRRRTARRRRATAGALEPRATRSRSRCCKVAAFVAFMLFVGTRVVPVAARRRRAHRLARAVHARRARHRARHRLRRRGALRRVVRARRVLRRRGDQPSPTSATKRRPTRCRCRTRSRCCSSSRSACCSTRASLIQQPLGVAGGAGASSCVGESRSPRSSIVLVVRLSAVGRR